MLLPRAEAGAPLATSAAVLLPQGPPAAGKQQQWRAGYRLVVLQKHLLLSSGGRELSQRDDNQGHKHGCPQEGGDDNGTNSSGPQRACRDRKEGGVRLATQRGRAVGLKPPQGGRQQPRSQTPVGVTRMQPRGPVVLPPPYRPQCPGGAGGWCPRAPAQRCTGGRQWRLRAGQWWWRHRRGRLRRAAQAAHSTAWGPGPAGTLLGDKHRPSLLCMGGPSRSLGQTQLSRALGSRFPGTDGATPRAAKPMGQSPRLWEHTPRRQCLGSKVKPGVHTAQMGQGRLSHPCNRQRPARHPRTACTVQNQCCGALVPCTATYAVQDAGGTARAGELRPAGPRASTSLCPHLHAVPGR